MHKLGREKIFRAEGVAGGGPGRAPFGSEAGNEFHTLLSTGSP